MLIYRIEGEDGKGMYCSENRLECDAIADMFDSFRHPGPEQDSKLVENLQRLNIKLRRHEGFKIDDHLFDISTEKYIYGFSSIEQLRNWIYKDEFLQDLHNSGFVLKIYNVVDEAVITGYTQAMFIKSGDVETHSIADYFGLKGE